MRRSCIGALFLALFLSGCADRDEAEVNELRVILQELASGEKPAGFAGFEGRAVAVLRDEEKLHSGSIAYDIRNGDAPTHADGSCEYHVLVSRSGDRDPFIGLRMNREAEGWHIAGFWTPDAAMGPDAPNKP